MIFKKKHMKKLIGLLMSAFLIAGCCNKEDSNVIVVEVVEEETATLHHEDDGEALGLNNGSKWLINDEMKPFVQETEAAVNQFSPTESADYEGLVELLKEKNTALIKSCTMEGESHDELHKWLHPHLELVSELEQAEGDDQVKIVRQLKGSFETFHHYFE